MNGFAPKDSQVTLDKALINTLLAQLGLLLSDRGVEAELYLVGGAAMALVYDDRRTTSDIDAIFSPRDIVVEAVAELAAEHGLPQDWLSDAVAFYLLPVPDANPRVLWQCQGVTISVASPEYLLAMKALVSRKSPSDLEDAALIAAELGLLDEREIEQVVRRYSPGGHFGAQELWFEDIASRAQAISQSRGVEPQGSW
ncbi:MAG: nucleotidyltransferase [Promicromonosporaceae bacterium]|nr:nucleotidyltransferase [Promicromonosporaceae bacterium]